MYSTFNITSNLGLCQAIGLRELFAIFKNSQGGVNTPDNYRGITVLSCFGK